MPIEFTSGGRTSRGFRYVGGVWTPAHWQFALGDVEWLAWPPRRWDCTQVNERIDHIDCHRNPLRHGDWGRLRREISNKSNMRVIVAGGRIVIRLHFS